MIYADICAGISAATVAWKPLRWRAAFYAEIEKFPAAVLARRYPKTPNLGDITRFEGWPDANLDVLVGGTPCQGFSIAGLRKGMDDDRSNLALYFGRIALRYKPRWIIWENVPGVRSSGEGRDLGAFLGGLAELGYGLAWRSLDAQYAGLAQRRERMFVVGYLGDWRPAAAVLFEPESLRWDSAPRREKGERVAGTISPGAHPGGYNGQDANNDLLIAHALRAQTNSSHRADAESYVTHALRADGFDTSEDGTGMLNGWAVRRLTPVECERLMGFEDNFTRISWRGKRAEDCPDGPRYRALGNSIDTHTLRWIGERIGLCDGLVNKLRGAA